MATERDTSTICLFDVDGTLTAPRQKITSRVEECLQRLNKKIVVGLVGGSDLAKIAEQMFVDVIHRYDYVFSENGLVAHKHGKLISKESIVSYMGEEKLQEFINFALESLSKIRLPCKRGSFIEFRSGLINVSPVHHVRRDLVKLFQQRFPDSGLTFSIGGQISIDVFPVGWDKRYCLKHIEKEAFNTIYFFGDKTKPGENDYEIYADERTKSFSVVSPEDTVSQLNKLFDV
ncbi:hypothetical protein HELRODRAFT_157435 [Helobdella robusta]|uniref:Phosphomannomutase n=1 Tax=Helobdella robusta TaxID=6412 RepID=T1EMB4_HELRO|nr:hypothetical protein HELRODRAFT_157435 [Helobdella robusta]ESO00125.1 hypothetical protein HELRODRAFT_157435 [Helobdella robusta]